ncbi:YhcN/YlaJ family sporulation lipoprotein [Virgibacillus sp. Bac330]|uniref:YhcN/YlaJ family sporulation lipoprotein n=1 Tax=Virgibacillus sp. Bac330 TaxID=2419841 RepID=UPI000EF51431|nr:YhcN/YlaJ family sporulation lipoprotein [Virgibacillus sp. Bac330]
MKRIIPIGLSVLFLATGCMDNDTATNERERIQNQLDPNKEAPADNDSNNRLGYVRYSKEQIDNDKEKQHSIRIDRTKMADMITRSMLRSDAFKEAATLVTDEEVLIAYEKADDFDKEKASQMAEKTAASILPRYFNIYSTDNTNLINDIQSLHNSTTTEDDYDNTINNIIKEMKNSK